MLKRFLHEVTLLGLGACLGLSACTLSLPSKPLTRPWSPAAIALDDKVGVEALPLATPADTVSARALAPLNESLPTETRAVWLKKEFWLGREIWLSLAVERSTLPGAATSVLGYFSTRLEQVGGELLLTRNGFGLGGGTTFTPEIPLNAYPILRETETEILVDLSKPKTPYGLSLVGWYGGDHSDAELEPRLEVVRSVEVSDGLLSFQTLLTAKRSSIPEGDPLTPPPAPGRSVVDPRLLSFTLRTDWVIPTPSPDFEALMPLGVNFFFVTEPYYDPNGAETFRLLNRISLSRPMSWSLTPNSPEHWREAIIQGITAWNELLGSEILQVEVGDGSRSPTDPRSSNLVWDDNRQLSSATARWRQNPYTGEVIQGQIYLPGQMWIEGAQQVWDSRRIERLARETLDRDAGHEAVARSTEDRHRRQARELRRSSRAAWASTGAPSFLLAPNAALARTAARSQHYCERTLPLTESEALVAAVAAPAPIVPEPEDTPAAELPERRAERHQPYPTESSTLEEFQARALRSAVMHETGHVLGLRHNLMASRESSKNGRIESGSIMDYNDLVVDTRFEQPGDLDRMMINLLYRGELPERPFYFCTDEDWKAGVPDCAAGDFGAEPIQGRSIREESLMALSVFLMAQGQADASTSLLQHAVQDARAIALYALASKPKMDAFLNSSDFEERQRLAWSTLEKSRDMHGLPIGAIIGPAYSDLVDLSIAEAASDATRESALLPEIVELLSRMLLDPEGRRKLEHRHAALAGLVRIQATEALAALHAAERGLESQGRTLDRELLALLRGELARGYFREVTPPRR